MIAASPTSHKYSQSTVAPASQSLHNFCSLDGKTHMQQSVAKQQNFAAATSGNDFQAVSGGQSRMHTEIHRLLVKMISSFQAEIAETTAALSKNSKCANLKLVQCFQAINECLDESKLEVEQVFVSLERQLCRCLESREKIIVTLKDHLELLEAEERVKAMVEAVRSVSSELAKLRSDFKRAKQIQEANMLLAQESLELMARCQHKGLQQIADNRREHNVELRKKSRFSKEFNSLYKQSVPRNPADRSLSACATVTSLPQTEGPPQLRFAKRLTRKYQSPLPVIPEDCTARLSKSIRQIGARLAGISAAAPADCN